DVIALAERGVGGILVDALGEASHAALLVREKSIPTVAVAGVFDRVRDGDEVLVDGYRGEVIVAPDEVTRNEFRRRTAEYRATIAALRDKPVTVRLLDVGGDKPLTFLPLPLETNPSLGVRGIRLLLQHPPLLRTQLRALVRLAQTQTVRVLVPMVTLEDDVAAARRAFDETCQALGAAKRPPFGAMIETPAAAQAEPATGPHTD